MGSREQKFDNNADVVYYWAQLHATVTKRAQTPAKNSAHYSETDVTHKPNHNRLNLLQKRHAGGVWYAYQIYRTQRVERNPFRETVELFLLLLLRWATWFIVQLLLGSLAHTNLEPMESEQKTIKYLIHRQLHYVALTTLLSYVGQQNDKYQGSWRSAEILSLPWDGVDAMILLWKWMWKSHSHIIFTGTAYASLGFW